MLISHWQPALLIYVPATLIGGIATFVRVRRSYPGFRIAFSVISGIFCLFLALTTGVHFCDQGTPPAFLALLLGVAAGFVAWGSWKTPKVILPILFLVCFVSSEIPAYLADLYHSTDYTGNSEYSSDKLWHTFVTGLRPRAPLSGR